MNFAIKNAISQEKKLVKGRLKRDLKNLIDYAIKMEKRLYNIDNPKQEKYY